MKRLVTKTKKLIKGMPSAVVMSILFHAGLFLLAGALVIFTVLPPPPVEFEPPPKVKVPKMPLKKLQVKMKKPTKPKSTAKITAMVPKLDLHDIQFPDLASSGIGAGLSDGGEVVGFGNMPTFDEEDGIFGGESSIGNDLEGTFYDLKRRRSGGRVAMDNSDFLTVVGKFTRGGWKSSSLAKYYRAPKKLYATAIMVPQMHSAFGPAAFNEPDTEGLRWLVHYKGKLVYPEPITFRFWGAADDLMLVRVDRKTVLNASRLTGAAYYSDWQSKGTQNRIHVLGNDYSTVGDWITLEPHTPLDMEVLIGERPGGYFNAMLLVEVKGVEYEMNKRGGPILPMFKTNEPSLDLMDAIYYNLVPGEASVTNGPVFRDY